MSERMAWREDAYAGFWQRVAGSIIDTLILWAAAMIVLVGLFAVIGGVAATGDPQDAEALAGVVVLLAMLGMAVAFFLYDTLMTSRTGATLGKRAAGVEVRTLDGDLPSFGLAAGRFFARYLSSMAFGLGYLWMLWDPQRQTWQDKLCNTVVVKREALSPVGSGWGQPPIAQAAGWGTPAGQVSGWGARADQGSGWGASAGQGSGWGASAGQGSGWGASADPASGQPSGWDAPAGPAATPWGAPQPEAPRPEGASDTPPGAGADADAGADEQEPDVDPVASPQSDRPGLHGETMETATWGRPQPTAQPTEPDTPPQTPFEPPADQLASPPRTPPPAPTTRPPEGQGGGPLPSDRPDPNVVAIDRARLASDAASWLQQVAGQVDARLDRVNPSWRDSAQADAARACAFGILLGHLARVHPHMAEDLAKVAEVHPSFSTLLEGSRLATLVEIAAEPGRATAWLGPLIAVTEREQIGRLLA